VHRIRVLCIAYFPRSASYVNEFYQLQVCRERPASICGTAISEGTGPSGVSTRFEVRISCSSWRHRLTDVAPMVMLNPRKGVACSSRRPCCATYSPRIVIDGVDELYRVITGQPRHRPPALGRLVARPLVRGMQSGAS
jgi:hypothetical protein